MIIRSLRLNDLDNLFDLFKLYRSEADEVWNDFPLDKHFLRLCITKMLPLTNKHILKVVEDSEKLVGIFIGTINYFIWSPEPIAYDVILYIHPEYRGTRLSVKLINKYKQWAKDLNCSKIIMSSISGINTERTQKFYEKLGFTNQGFMNYM